jgi:hypothetical protein
VAGLGIAFAASGGQPSARHHNSAGCVPHGDSGDPASQDPDACGPGNYPRSAFYRDEQGVTSLVCSDSFGMVPAGSATPADTPKVAAGEPDPDCKPVGKADKDRIDAVNQKINDDHAHGRDKFPASAGALNRPPAEPASMCAHGPDTAQVDV